MGNLVLDAYPPSEGGYGNSGSNGPFCLVVSRKAVIGDGVGPGEFDGVLNCFSSHGVGEGGALEESLSFLLLT